MKNEVLLLNKKHTDTFIEKTKTRRKETLESILDQQREIFSFSPPKNLSEGGKWLLVVTSSEATNTVFNLTRGNNSFSITRPGYWTSRGSVETFIKLRDFLQRRTQKWYWIRCGRI